MPQSNDNKSKPWAVEFKDGVYQDWALNKQRELDRVLSGQSPSLWDRLAEGGRDAYYEFKSDAADLLQNYDTQMRPAYRHDAMDIDALREQVFNEEVKRQRQGLPESSTWLRLKRGEGF